MNTETLTDKIRNEIKACERKKIDAAKQMSRYAATIEALEEQKLVLMEILEKAEEMEEKNNA